MSPLGKIIGAILGLLVGGPVGIVWGALVGHLLVDNTPVDSATQRGLDRLKNKILSKTSNKLQYFIKHNHVNFLGKLIGFFVGFVLWKILGGLIGLLAGHFLIDEKSEKILEIREWLDANWDKNWCKIAGALAGFLLFPPYGVVFGLVGGHYLDFYREHGMLNFGKKSNENIFKKASFSHDAKHVSLIQTMAALSAKLAKVDGVVTKAEINVFKELFSIPEKDYKKIAAIFDNAKKSSSGFEEYALRLKTIYGHDRKVMEQSIDALFKVAAADDAVSDDELKFISDVSNLLDIPRPTFEYYRNKFRMRREAASDIDAISIADAYKILGLSAQSSDREIKSARRKLVRENHPDHLIADGKSQKEIKKATLKIARINAAYDVIRDSRNLR